MSKYSTIILHFLELKFVGVTIFTRIRDLPSLSYNIGS